MLSQIQDALNVYLVPFMIATLIAIAIATVLYLLATRRGDGPPAPREPTSTQPDRLRSPTAKGPQAPVTPRAALAPSCAPLSPAMPAALAAVLSPGISSQPAAAALPAAWRQAAAPRSPLPAHTASGWHTDITTPLPGLALAAAPTPARLLLVDDSAVARAKLRKLFESAGYTADLARDGLEALDLLAKGRYALMITDLEMPNMNGIELIAAVNGNPDTVDMPVLAITGHDDLQAKVNECQGLFGIFKKPWNDRELLRRVQALADLQPAQPAPAARH